MAIERMKLLSISGKEEILDNFLAKDLLTKDIGIEDAKKIYGKSWKFEYCSYDYSVKEYLNKIEKLFMLFEIENNEIEEIKTKNTIEQIKEQIDEIENIYSQYIDKRKILVDRNEEIKKVILPVKDLADIDYNIEELINLKYVRFRYGYIPNASIKKVERELDELPAIFYKLNEQEDITSIIYLTTEEYKETVDTFFNMQEFERILLPDAYEGKMSEFISNLQNEFDKNQIQIDEIENEIKFYRKEQRDKLIFLYQELKNYEYVNKIKKYIMRDKHNTFYMVIWVPNSSIDSIIKMLESEKKLEYTIHNAAKEQAKEPTKLRNNKLFKPFEVLVNMYGYPNVKEIDPTVFVAITAFIMFGFMFGDIGHGIVILLFGLFLTKRKANLGPVFIAGGISSIIFGFLYGSIFGKEDIIKPILVSPMENINTMLISGICVGSIFILVAIILNIINGIKNKEIKRIVFDKNGLAGFLLYFFVLGVVAIYFLKGKLIVSIPAIVIISLVLVLLILFGDNLSNLIKKKKKTEVNPFVERVFDIIEMLLSFASNTISFLRLAAFAINHVGLCMAIYLLANMTNGAGNIIISIIGNCIVIVLEGLIVGIQVLRLEYYELFSRFFSGDGREYKTIKEQAKSN